MRETVVVRPAGPADVSAAAEVWYVSRLARRNGRALPEVQHDLVHGSMADPGAVLLVAEDFGPEPAAGPDPYGSAVPPVVGSILGIPGREDDGDGRPVPGLLHISLVSVLPDRWDGQVGRLLVETMLQEAAAHGYQRVQLWTHADSSRANRLYRAKGFRRTGRARVDEWGDLLVEYQVDVCLQRTD